MTAGFGAAVRAELTKIRTLRAPLLVLLLTLLLTIGVSLANGSSFRRALDAGQPQLPDFDPARAGLTGVAMAQLGLLVFGILVGGGEYAGRTIQVALAAVPRRERFYLAKLTAGGLVATLVSVVCVATGYLTTQSALGPHAAPRDVPGLYRALAGGVAFLLLFFLLTTALAMLVRHQVLALAVLVPFFFLGGFRMLTLIPGLEDVALYLPDTAGARMTALGADLQQGPAPLTGGLVALAWTALAVAAGAVALRRRDA